MKIFLVKVFALILSLLALSAFATDAEYIKQQKERFTHAEFYYPRGKYDSLNKVRIDTCHLFIM